MSHEDICGKGFKQCLFLEMIACKSQFYVLVPVIGVVVIDGMD